MLNDAKEIKAILTRFGRWFKNPNSIDSDNALIHVFREEYHKNGIEAARKEVARRISLGREMRKLREMACEQNVFVGWTNPPGTTFHVDYSLDLS